MRRALVAWLVVPLLVGSATSADGAPGTLNGRIAFERSGFFGGTEVWTMDQDGTDLRRVGPGSDPAWSPDGAHTLLVDPEGRLVVVRADGSDERRLEVTGGPIRAMHPAWSPDGSSVAFGGPDGVYLVPAGGGAARRLVAAYEPAPAWSPDGSQLAFIGTGGAVSVMNADGSGLRILPGAKAEGGRRVSWSPDGSTIAFGDAQSADISTARVDGGPSRLRIQAPGVGQTADPAWSPDGRRIAFVDNGVDICVVDTDGGRVVRLTYAHDDVWSDRGGGNAHNTDPAWQPRPAGSTPAGGTGAPLGPAADWDRAFSWGWACSLVHQGRALSGTVSARRVKVGDVVTFRVRLANTSTIPIGENGLVEFHATLDGGAHVVSVATTRGRCRAEPFVGNAPAISVECGFGSLFPGESFTATLRVRPTAPGEVTLVTSMPKPLPPGDGTDASDPDLVQRVPVAGCTLRGRALADVLDGSASGDVLCGLDGNDRMRGGAGRDSFYAGPGDDTLLARDRDRDRVSCGSGEDTVVADRIDRVDADCERVRRDVSVVAAPASTASSPTVAISSPSSVSR